MQFTVDTSNKKPDTIDAEWSIRVDISSAKDESAARKSDHRGAPKGHVLTTTEIFTLQFHHTFLRQTFNTENLSITRYLSLTVFSDKETNFCEHK